jgi:hypothetical protein
VVVEHGWIPCFHGKLIQFNLRNFLRDHIYFLLYIGFTKELILVKGFNCVVIDKLPLDIRGIILNKVWNEGRDLGVVLVSKGELLLPLPLQFLFSQYGRLKEITQPIISVGCGAWNGTSITSRKQSKQYVFEYGTLNLKNKVITPNFLNKELYKSPTEVYGFLSA